jgi:hypothetical protein
MSGTTRKTTETTTQTAMQTAMQSATTMQEREMAPARDGGER